jgi:hypothetical protein
MQKRTNSTQAVVAGIVALSASVSACTVSTTTQAPQTVGVSAGAQGGEVAASGGAAASPASGGACATVRVFDDTGFNGQSLELNAGRYDVGQFDGTAVPNDSIRSVCVPPGWRVTLYADSGFAGDHVDLTSSVADLANFSGSASSAVVTAPGQ